MMQRQELSHCLDLFNIDLKGIQADESPPTMECLSLSCNFPFPSHSRKSWRHSRWASIKEELTRAVLISLTRWLWWFHHLWSLLIDWLFLVIAHGSSLATPWCFVVVPALWKLQVLGSSRRLTAWNLGICTFGRKTQGGTCSGCLLVRRRMDCHLWGKQWPKSAAIIV
jgi:hypothetical protein